MSSNYLFKKRGLNQNNNCFRPIIYRLNLESDKKAFETLLEEVSNVLIFDEINSQLTELIKLRNPKLKFDLLQVNGLIEKHLGGIPIEEYGVWVYYPWSNRLVHLLDEEEFVLVRTNRNQYKITPEECSILSKKKIGVIGLSVGQSVAITLAMERCFGEIRLADFDTLELNNLNRIRTGVHNLGLNKAYSVAREISEIDPFLEVKCFPDGLTEDNMDSFFLDSGKLDILVEECDGLDVKILCRIKAKELGIPVIMEASDKCMVDVERFDLNDNLPILHGLIKHLDVKKIKELKTNEEKIPYLLDIIGIDTCSTRLKASMLEIDQSITTWPQLASAVTMGGGVMTDVARRVLLNQFTDSGRYYIDVEELIKNSNDENKTLSTPIEKNLLSLEQMRSIIENNNFNDFYSENLPSAILEKIIEASSLAPSGGNVQPWKWLYKDNVLYLFHDSARSDSMLDYLNNASYIGLGAAVENLVLKSHEYKLEVFIKWFPISEERKLIAKVNFYKDKVNSKGLLLESHGQDHLSSCIEKRLTNRKTKIDRSELLKSVLENIKVSTESIPGARLQLIEDEKSIEELGDIISEIEKIRIMTKRGHSDFVNEIRWTELDALNSRDGIDIRTVELTVSEDAGFRVARDWGIIEKLSDWKGGDVFKKLALKGVASSSCLGVILMPTSSNQDFINGGRSVQRAWLSAAHMDIAFQPMSPSTFLFSKLIDNDLADFSEVQLEKLKILRKKFTKLLSLEPGIGEIFIFRLFKADDPEVKSLRLPLGDILYIN